MWTDELSVRHGDQTESAHQISPIVHSIQMSLRWHKGGSETHLSPKYSSYFRCRILTEDVEVKRRHLMGCAAPQSLAELILILFIRLKLPNE